MNHSQTKDLNLILIRVLAILLFVLGMGIASLNFGLAADWQPAKREALHTVYMWFEHIFRALTVFLGSFLTYRYLKRRKSTVSAPQKLTLLSFSISALLLLVLWPLITGYWKMYEVLMPFPWSTLPFQLISSGTYFGNAQSSWRGIDGVTLLLWGYFIYQIVIFTGTILLGRKWHCSMICLLNGCHAESLGLALPVIRHNKKRPFSKQIHPTVRSILRALQIFLFTLNMLLILFWSLYMLIGRSLLPLELLLRIESLKYTSLELTLLMFLWFLIGGRGYCFYCPAGFALGIVGNLAGQKIESGLTHCTECGQCNDACKLSIDIRARARENKPVRALQCVGCELCSANCPTGNLRYTTYFLTRIRRCGSA